MNWSVRFYHCVLSRLFFWVFCLNFFIEITLKVITQGHQGGSEALVTKPNNLSSISRICIVIGEKHLLQVVLWPPHINHSHSRFVTFLSYDPQVLKLHNDSIFFRLVLIHRNLKFIYPSMVTQTFITSTLEAESGSLSLRPVSSRPARTIKWDPVYKLINK